MRSFQLMVGALVLVSPVSAQQAGPATAASEPSKAVVTVTLRGAEGQAYVAVKAEAVPVRDVLREVATKAGVRILMSPSVGGSLTASVEAQPLDKALAALSAPLGFSVRAISVPSGDEGKVSVDVAADLYEALQALPLRAAIADPVSGKAIAVQPEAPKDTAGLATVFYVQGKLTPAQERAAAVKRETDRVALETARNAAGSAPATREEYDKFVGNAITGLKTLAPEQRVGVMMDFVRQFQESLTPDERGQMRDAFRSYVQQNRGQGGPGGFFGGPPPTPR